MGVVDFQYYTGVYQGNEVDQASFPALNAQAERMISAMTRWQVNEGNISEFHSLIQTQYKLAVCSQIDFLSLNGMESINDTGGGGFTVGKVTVHGKGSSVQGGAMSGNISPAALLYLEQSGLMNPGIPVYGGGHLC